MVPEAPQRPPAAALECAKGLVLGSSSPFWTAQWISYESSHYIDGEIEADRCDTFSVLIGLFTVFSFVSESIAHPLSILSCC